MYFNYLLYTLHAIVVVLFTIQRLCQLSSKHGNSSLLWQQIRQEILSVLIYFNKSKTYTALKKGNWPDSWCQSYSIA